ncbi:MAG: hypothetical protein RDV48_05340 [Candidatus Eremiobacteraeota bacterium]|nr:hypothetical protein [Candidatus Eremiobacteraeota bacterium]
MAGLRHVPDEKLVEKYYLILNNRIEVPHGEIQELQQELRRREINETPDDRHMEIFIRCLDVDRIRQFVKQAFAK